MSYIDFTYVMENDNGAVVAEIEGRADFRVTEFSLDIIDVELIELGTTDYTDCPAALEPFISEFLRAHDFYAAKMFEVWGEDHPKAA